MIWLIRYIVGFVRFSYLDGFKESFINTCFKNNIDIKNIELTDRGFNAFCSIKAYKKLHTIALKSGGRVKVTKKCGLPFILHPIKNRFGFLTGAVAFIFIISLLTSFAWNIDIKGCNNISEVTIRSYLEQNGLSVGSMWSAVDKDKLCASMMSEFDEIAWVHINQIGARAQVEINEITPPPKPNRDKLKGKLIYRKTLEAVAYREQSSLKLKDIKTYTRLKFYWLDIPLYLSKKQGDIEEIERKSIEINKIPLPIGYTKYIEKWITYDTKTLSDKELEELAKRKLEYAESQELDGYKIINRSVEPSIDKDKCVISASYIIKENNK